MVSLVLQEMTLRQIMSGICKIVTNMKKFIKPFVLVAAAAMALASCQKNEIPAPEKQDVHFTINAGIGTKTSIEETLEDGKTVYKAKWNGNEELGLLFTAPDQDTKAENVVNLTNAESGEVASFQGNVTVTEPNGTFYSFYPASAFNRGYEQGDARLDLKNVQKPTATSFDPSCDILVAKPYDYTVEDGAVVAEGLEFARIMSVLRIDLKSDFADVQNEFVESFSFTAGDVKITGYARIFLENPEFTGNWASTEQKYCTVTANYDSDLVSINGTSNSVYLVIAPVTIPANKDLTFEIKTKNYKISKTVKSPEMKFTAGKVSKINLAIASDNCEKVDLSVDYSGEYLILGDNNGTKYAAVKHDGSSNNLKGVALTLEGDKVLEFDGMADSKMVVTKVVGGTYDGLYTIMDASGKYLYAASSSGNQLKSAALSTSTPQHYYWSIVEKEGVYEIIASKSANRNVMQFNYNNGSPIFNCYSSASQKAVALYAYSDIKPDTTPKISVTNAAYSVKATDTSVEIPYTVKNITGAIAATVADGATMSNVSANVTADKITVSFAANEESAEKTATIVLSYEGAQSVNVVITQEGKPAEGGEAKVEVWSWAGGGKANFTGGNIQKTYGLGSDYAEQHAPYQIKMDDTGDYFIIKVDGAIKSVSVGVKMIGGGNNSTLDVQGSSDGESYSSVEKLAISGSQNAILELQTTKQFDPSYRYLKFYFTKGSNIGVGPISITYIVGSESGAETPETPEAVTLKSIAVSGQKTAYNVGDAFVKPTVTATYSDESTKTVTDAAVFNGYDLSAAGTQTVTVQYTEEGVTVNTTYSITVTGATATKSWKLVTDASTLKSGDKLAIVSTSKGKIASATISSSIMGELAVTITNNSFATLPSGAAELTLGGSSGAWTLTNASGKKLGATAVKKVAWGSGTTTWAITIASNGDATIQSTTSSYGRFLHNVSSTRFTTYTSAANTSMLLPQLYRYE